MVALKYERDGPYFVEGELEGTTKEYAKLEVETETPLWIRFLPTCGFKSDRDANAA